MAVLGAVLAGGRGRRLGGPGKAVLELDGKPLLHYPLAVLRDLFGAVVVVAKADNPVLPLPHGVELWIEPDEPRHPRAGVIEALRRAAGQAVFVCAADMPLIDRDELRAIMLADELHAGEPPAAVVPRVDGRLQPLCALYRPAALPILERARPGASLMQSVARLAPLIVERRDPRPYLNVNRRADLEAALIAIRT
jgi:molybdopterin-guanine dinucleotide biosynthesis protein A